MFDAVICRPTQLRQAALALSCCQRGRLVPLIVLEPPPVSEERYRQLYEQYLVARNARDDMANRIRASGQPFDPVAAHKLSKATDMAAGVLTPFRSWWKQNRQAARFLEQLHPKRLLALCRPPLEEAHPIHPIPVSRITDTRSDLLPSTAHVEFVLPATEAGGTPPAGCRVFSSLAELATTCWALAHPGVSFPATCVPVADDQVASYLEGLHQALDAGMPLLPDAGPGAVPVPSPTSPVAPTEAVLVEAVDEAWLLVGVLQAHARRSRLVVYPRPNRDTVDRALRGMRELVESLAERSKRSARRPKPGPVLGRALDNLHAHKLREIEDAVSSLVPDRVFASIGSLPLTAYTDGIPYTFARHHEFDWREKSIGHVTPDATLVVLHELTGVSSDDAVGFHLVFDTGAFGTPETRDVVKALEFRASSTLVLRDFAATGLALIHLTQELPVDVVFFNTHGSDQGIAMKDADLPAFKLVQRVDLSSRPIVFNNSCLSWVSVGREFLRIGARAYVGSLWSIDSADAAKVAAVVLRRMVREGQPVCRALLDTGAGIGTERAYITIGTCTTGLPQQPAYLGRERKWLLLLLEKLFSAAQRWVRDRRGVRSPVDFVGPLEDALLAEADRLGEAFDQGWPAPSLERVQVWIQQLQYLGMMAQRRPKAAGARLDLIERARRSLDALDGPGVEESRAELFKVAGELLAALGRYPGALELLEGSLASDGCSRTLRGGTLLSYSDVLKVLGRIEDALGAAEQARELFDAPQPTPADRWHQLLALGRVAQASNRLGRHTQALLSARHGLALASQLDNTVEIALFKCDEAKALLGLRRFPDALEAAQEAARLAGRAYDDSQELEAMEVTVRVLVEMGDFEGALGGAMRGLARARAQGDQYRDQNFQRIIEFIESAPPG
ncbi:MAG: tetratricopeptide repeat protein [Planctomycetes bacterium]|nr:tetratricopeptide repeat protein [Planctomycetota bacterium]